MVRAGLQRIIDATPDIRVAAVAVDGAGTLVAIRDPALDIVMLDLTMPAPNGTELIERIRAHRPDLPILVVTMHNDPAVARAALEAGASGYITKDSEPDMLLDALRKVLGGDRFVEGRVATAMLFAKPRPTPASLTPRETEVLRRLADGQTNAQIARALYLSEKTVSTHKSNIMGKLELNNTADLVRFADQHFGE